MGNPVLKILKKISFGNFLFLHSAFTCEYDGVKRVRSPKLHEMNGIPETKARMTAENDARLTEFVAEILRVNIFKMFQAAVFNQKGMGERFLRDVNFVLFGLGQPFG